MNKKRKIAPNRQSRPTQLASERQLVAKDLEDVTPVIEFLDQFLQLSDPRAQLKSKLISIKIPEPLLSAFKYKAELERVPYQSMIKRLMVEWLSKA